MPHLPTTLYQHNGLFKILQLPPGPRSHLLHRRSNSCNMPGLRRQCSKVDTTQFWSVDPAWNTHQISRGAICTSCGGRGFSIFTCGHCNPSAVVAASNPSSASGTSSATASTTPGSSAPSSPGSLSRSPSTSYPSHSDPRTGRAWRPPGDAGNGSNCGRVGTQTPRNL